MLASGGVITNAIRTLSAGSSTVNSVAISSSALRLLTSFCRGSPNLTLTILLDGICPILASLLHADPSAGTIAAQLDKNDSLALVLELLPRLPPDVSPISAGRSMYAIPSKEGRQAYAQAVDQFAASSSSGPSEKERVIVIEHSEQVVAIGEALLPSILEGLSLSLTVSVALV